MSEVQTLFDETLPPALAANAAHAQGINAKFQFHVTGEGGGDWFVDVSKKSGVSCTPGIGENPTCTIEVKVESFAKLRANPLNVRLRATREVKVSGRKTQMMMLRRLFAYHLPYSWE